MAETKLRREGAHRGRHTRPVPFADDLDHPAVHINALGTALRGRPSWDQFDDMTTMAARDAAASMWERTDLTPADVDMAQLVEEAVVGAGAAYPSRAIDLVIHTPATVHGDHDHRHRSAAPT